MKRIVYMILLLASLTNLTVSAQDELEATAAPVIEVVDCGDHVNFVFTFEGEEGDVMADIYVNGELVMRIDGSFPWGEGIEGPTSVYGLERTNWEQYVEIQAQARIPGKGWSETTQFSYLVTALPVTEQTMPPGIHERRYPETSPMEEHFQCYESYSIGFENTDPESVTIYYRYHYYLNWNGAEVSSDWKTAYLTPGFMPEGVCVDPDLWLEESAYGWVEAYSVADYKTESERVRIDFNFECYPSIHFSRNYDFKAGGLYYTILSDEAVAVTSRTIDWSAYNYDPYGPVDDVEEYVLDPDLLSMNSPWYYDEEIIIPSTVDYGGKTYTVTAVNECAFKDCQSTSIQLPNTITKIGGGAFFNTSIPEIRIPDSVTQIGPGAFWGCSELTTITIPDAVSTISKKMFKWCYNLSHIEVPSTVTSIEEEAFKNCENLISIDIPASVVEIGSMTFAGCSALTSVTCRGIVPPFSIDAFYYGEEYSDYSIYDQATLFVPNEALEDYRVADEWCRFSRIVPFLGAGPGDVNGDGKLAITDVSDLIGQLLNGGEPPAYCDVNGDGNIGITDVTTLIEMLLNGN